MAAAAFEASLVARASENESSTAAMNASRRSGVHAARNSAVDFVGIFIFDKTRSDWRG